MRKKNSLVYYVTVFTLAQLAWFSLLALWITWYVSNYIMITEVGDQVSTEIISKSTSVLALIGGLVLLVVISIAMSLIFIYLTKQMNLTKLYDNFIANVTHELKSPLSSIQLYLETMKSRTVPKDKQKEFLNLMLRDTRRLNHLINSILEISGMEQKKLAHNYSVIEIQKVTDHIISEAITDFRLPENAVRCEGEVDCLCVIDQDAFKIVINNLFDNAIKYSRGEVEIYIQLSQNKKYFVFKFRDQGIGVPIKKQEKIFYKFLRIYDQQSPSVKGTGLGLYWVSEIIKSHGGKISVYSAGRNQGTTFTIELPIYRTTKKRYINYLLKVTNRNVSRMEAHNDKE
jgi:signal transduction histidine kinase